MLKPFLILALFLALLLVVAGTAQSTIYMWTDATGVRNVTDEPGSIPSGVRVQAIEANLDEVRTSAAEVPTPVIEPLEPLPGDVVTQAEFAVQLAAELGLGAGLSPETAANRLSDVRIAPRLADWELDAPVTPALLDRFRKLTVGAAAAGRIPMGPEEARFAFDSATALAGVSGYAPTLVVPEPTPYIVEEVPVPVHVAPPIVHESVIFFGAHFGHGGFRKHHHGVHHRHHHKGFRKHHRGLKHKRHHGVHHKHHHGLKPRHGFHLRHKHHRHHKKGEVWVNLNKHKIINRTKHNAKLRTHMPGLDLRGGKVIHRASRSHGVRGARGHGRVSARRGVAGRGGVSVRRGAFGQRRVGGVRMRSRGRR